MNRNNEKSRFNWFLVSLTFILIAIIIDIFYYSNNEIYGWYFIDDWREFNFAGIFWIIGISILSILIVSKLIERKSTR